MWQRTIELVDSFRWNRRLTIDRDLKIQWQTTTSQNYTTPGGFLEHPLPTTQTLAIFSDLSYYDKDKVVAELRQHPILKGQWELLAFAETNVKWTLTNGYRGIAVVNPHTNQIVVAHRGTPAWWHINSDLTDLMGVCGDKFTGHMLSAMTFTEEVLSKTRARKIPKTILITGHSLGGWLTIATAFSAQYLVPVNGIFKCTTTEAVPKVRPHCVAFDGPGARSMLRKLQDNCGDCSVLPSTSIQELDITNYISSLNIVNGVKHHVGRVLQTDSTDHSLTTILSLFDKKGEFPRLRYIVDFSSSVAGVIFTKSDQYQALPYEGARYSLLAFSPVAQIFLRAYNKLFLNSFPTVPIDTLAGIDVLLSEFTIEQLHVTLPTKAKLRSFVPNIEKLIRVKPYYILEVLGHWNIHRLAVMFPIRFTTDILSQNDLSAKSSHVLVTTKSDFSVTALRVLHSLQQRPKKTLLLTQHDLLYTRMWEELDWNLLRHTLIILLDSGTPLEYYINTVSNILQASSSSFILCEENSEIQRDLHRRKVPCISYNPCAWTDLDAASQNILVQKKCIAFQGYSDCVTSMAAILQESQTDASTNNFSSNLLLSLIQNKTISIGQPVLSTSSVPIEYTFGKGKGKAFSATSLIQMAQRKDIFVMSQISETELRSFFSSKSNHFRVQSPDYPVSRSRNIIYMVYQNEQFQLTKFKGDFEDLVRYAGQHDITPSIELATYIQEFNKLYISRSFSVTEYIVNMKQAYSIWGSNDLIVLEGLEQELLKKKVQEMEMKTTKFQYGASNELFSEYCSNTTHNIYCLRYESDCKFILTMFRGPIEPLRKALTPVITNKEPHSSWNNISEASFINLPDFRKLTSYGGEPGTGKTSLLEHLSLLLKQKNPSWFVKCLHLNRFCKTFKDYQESQEESVSEYNTFFSFDFKDLVPDGNGNRQVTVIDAVSFLVNNMLCLSNVDEIQLFHHCVKAGSCVVFLDGFDEISPYYKGLTLSIVSGLINQSNIKVFISTRTNLQPSLENTLHSFSYKLGPFSEKEKNAYLEKNCTSRTAIEAVKKSLSTFTGSAWTEFANIPIILWMLVDEATAGVDIPNFKTPAELYHRILTRKLEVLAEHHDVVGRSTFLKYKKDTWLIHQKIAQELLCPQTEVFRVDVSVPSEDEEVEVKILKWGVVVERGNELEFIHHTIPEYFVAYSVFQLLLQTTITVQLHNFITESILKEKQYKNVRRFLGDILQSSCRKFPNIIQNDLETINTEQFRESFLHVACRENNLPIIEYFLLYLNHQQHLNINMESLELMRMTKNRETPAYVAASSGNWEALTLISRSRHSCASLSTHDVYNTTALHKALEISTTNEPERTKWLQEVLTKDTEEDEQGIKWDVRNSRDETPLIHAIKAAKFQVVQYFMNHRIDLFDNKDRYQASAFHYLLSSFDHWWEQPTKLEWLKTFLSTPSEKVKQILWENRDIKGRTAFHYAAMRGQFNVFAFLAGAWTDHSYLTLRDDHDRTPVHFLCLSPSNTWEEPACQHWFNERSTQFDWYLTDRDGNTPLHFAGQSSNYTIFKMIQSNLPRSFEDLVCLQNKRKYTTFHYLVNSQLSFENYQPPHVSPVFRHRHKMHVFRHRHEIGMFDKEKTRTEEEYDTLSDNMYQLCQGNYETHIYIKLVLKLYRKIYMRHRLDRVWLESVRGLSVWNIPDTKNRTPDSLLKKR